MLSPGKNSKKIAKTKEAQPRNQPRITTGSVKQQKKKELNPYGLFLRNHENATVEDLTKFFEVTAQSRTSSTTALATMVVAIFATLMASYHYFIDSSLDVLPNYIILAITGFMIAVIAMAVGVLVFLVRLASPVKIGKNFDMYLQAKRQLEKSKEDSVPPESQDVEQEQE